MNPYDVGCTVADIEAELSLGKFVPASDMAYLVMQLEHLHSRIKSVATQKPVAAVGLYEALLVGCRRKVEDCTDPQNLLPVFFRSICVGWIKARQRAGLLVEDTVHLVIRWLTSLAGTALQPPIGPLVKALNKRGYELFAAHFLERCRQSRALLDQPALVRCSALADAYLQDCRTLREIYRARRDIPAYRQFCDETWCDQDDSANLATMAEEKGDFEDAIRWVADYVTQAKASGISCPDVSGAICRILALQRKIGRNEDTGRMAWRYFAESPSLLWYNELMRSVSHTTRHLWKARARLRAACDTSPASIEVLVATEEWCHLAKRIHRTEMQILAPLGDHLTTPGWLSLGEQDAAAAARLHVAVAFHILSEGSADHTLALRHLQQARDLYRKAGDAEAWKQVVTRVALLRHDGQGVKERFARIAAWAPATDVVPLDAIARAEWDILAGQPLQGTSEPSSEQKSAAGERES